MRGDVLLLVVRSLDDAATFLRSRVEGHSHPQKFARLGLRWRCFANFVEDSPIRTALRTPVWPNWLISFAEGKPRDRSVVWRMILSWKIRIYRVGIGFWGAFLAGSEEECYSWGKMKEGGWYPLRSITGYSVFSQANNRRPNKKWASLVVLTTIGMQLLCEYNFSSWGAPPISGKLNACACLRTACSA